MTAREPTNPIERGLERIGEELQKALDQMEEFKAILQHIANVRPDVLVEAKNVYANRSASKK